MRDLSVIPLAMTDIERTSRAARLLARIGCVGRSTHPARGGDVGKGSRPETRSIVPHSHTPQHSQQEAVGLVGRPANEARAKPSIVRVRRLDHGAATAIVIRHAWIANLRWRVKSISQGWAPPPHREDIHVAAVLVALAAIWAVWP